MSPDIQLVLQFVIGLSFLSSAVGKLLAPALFFDGLHDYRIFPRSSAKYLGILVIAIEGVIAFSYLSGWLLHPAGILALALLAVFLLISSLALKRGIDVRCLCFGANDMEPLSLRTVIRIALLATALLTLVMKWPIGEEALRSTYTTNQVISALTCAVLVQILTSWMLAMPEFTRLMQECRTCGQQPGQN